MSDSIFVALEGQQIPVAILSNGLGGTADAASAGALAGAATGAAAGAAAVNFALDYTGAGSRPLSDRFQEMPVSVGDFAEKVVGDDWTDAINAALAADRNVYLPGRVGGYKVTSQLNMRAAGNFIVGDGVTESFLVIEDDFDLGADAVLFVPDTAGENQAGLHDVGFVFDQPLTGVRANFTQYPYALSARGVTRLMLGNLRITGGYKGLDLRDNTGGLMGGRWEIGCINEGITGGDATGGTPALDFWHIDTIHVWPFGFQDGTRYPAYRDGSTIAARLGRIDGLQIKDFSSFSARFITEAASGEGPFGTISGLQLDGRYARLEYGAGRMAVGSFYGTTDIAGDYKIRVTGGHLNVGSGWGATSATTGTTPLFSAAGGYLSVANLTVANCNPLAGVFQSETNGEMQVHGCTFLGLFGTTRTLAVVRQVGTGVLHCTDNIFQVPGSGTGSAISVETDSASITIKDNIYNGWGVTLPADPAGGYAGDYGQAIRRTRTIAAADPLPLLSTDEYVVVTGNTDFGTIQTTKAGQEVTLLFTGTPLLANAIGNNEYAGLEPIQACNGLVLKLVMTATGWKEVDRKVNNASAGLAVTTPAPIASSGSFTSAASSLSSRLDAYYRVEFSATITITTAGTASGQVQLPLPYNADRDESFAAVETGTNTACIARLAAGSNALTITKYDGTFVGTSGAVIVVSGRYRADV